MLIRNDNQCDIYKIVSYGDSKLFYENFFNEEDYRYDYNVVETCSEIYNKQLIECDYCGKLFYLDRRKRQQRISEFTRRRAQFNHRDLYKDNCKSCRYIKAKETMLMRHGVTSMLQKEDVMRKTKKTLSITGNTNTSRQQEYIAGLLGIKSNQAVGLYVVDMIYKNNIIIEYDGGGHNLSVLMGYMNQQEFDKRERIREDYLISKGYKVIRLDSPSDLLPKDDKILELINKATKVLEHKDVNIYHIKIPKRKSNVRYGKLYYIEEILKHSERDGVQHEIKTT